MGRRALLISLIVSLLVNVFVIGAVAGALVIGQRGHMRVGMHGGGLWTAASELGPQRQQTYRAALRETGDIVRPKLREARRERRDAWGTLRDERFDPAVTRAALDRARLREQEARGLVEHRIVDYAATLSPAERAKLGQALARTSAWRGRRGPPQPKPDGPPAAPSRGGS